MRDLWKGKIQNNSISFLTSKEGATQMNQNIENAAIKAVYGLQYNTTRAARFVMSEVPNTSQEAAVKAINTVARAPKKSKK